MKILASHVSRTVFSAMLLVLVLLLGLELVFAFIGELENVKGSFTTLDALLIVLWSAPARAYEMLSISALIGGMTGLGVLASNSELTVMRAAGTSIGRIVWWVIKPAMVLAVVGLLLSQYIVPYTEKKSEHYKESAEANLAEIKWLKGSWQREGQYVVQIGRIDEKGDLRNVTLFHFSEQHLLESTALAEQAHYDGAKGWWLQNITTTYLNADGSTRLENQSKQYWQSQLTPSYLGLIMQDAESLSLTDLYHYAHYMKAQGLDANAWFLQFWKKVLAPIAALSMVLIACSFIFGPLRSVTMGLRILAGILAGLTFRYGQDFLGFASLVYDFSPIAAAGLPVAFCLLIGGVALMRVK